MNDDELINNCVIGEYRAHELFIKRFSKIIYGSIVNALRKSRLSFDEIKNIAEDLTQDVYISLWKDDCRALKCFNGTNGCPLEGYIGTIAVRKAVDYLRSLKIKISLDAVVETESGEMPVSIKELESHSTEDQVSLIADKDSIEKLLKNLEEDDQKLCQWHFLEQEDPDEV